MKTKAYLLIFIALVIASCKTQQRQFEKFAAEDLDFKYFTSKSKIKYSGPENNLSVTSHIRAEKDEAIWVSIHKMGREFVRVMFTKDSLKILDKQHKVYSILDYATLSENTGVEINYKMVQNMLFGNLPYQKKHDGKVGKEEHFLVYKQNSERFEVDNFVNDSTRRLEKFVVKEKHTTNNMEVNYSEFEVVNKKLLATLMKIDILFTNEKGENKMNIEMNHLKPEFTNEQQKFPFTIPDSYERE